MQEEPQPVLPQDDAWQYSPENEEPARTDTPPQQEITWTASEYISHEKGPSWYVGLGLSIFVITLVVFVFTREFVSSAVMIVIGIAFGAFAARKPNELEYSVNNQGVLIGNKAFGFDEFKSFSVSEDGPVRSVVLSPLQRFTLPISIYYDPTDEDKIVNALSLYLPYENRRYDLVDRIMKKIRF